MITFQLDPDKDLTPEEFRMLKVNALLAGRTVDEQLRAVFFGGVPRQQQPDPPPSPPAGPSGGAMEGRAAA